MLRNIGAVIAGLLVGSAANMAILGVSSMVYPRPEGMDFNDQAQLAAYIATLPTAAFFFVLAAHLGQAFVGGWLAARLSASQPVWMALFVGTVTAMAGLYYLISLPGPVWLWIEMPLYFVLSWLPGSWEEARRAGGSRVTLPEPVEPD
jgi:hypothetical protein